jgi:prepilin-type N-terminal cleavage/methylation domain-containing protein
MCRKLIAKNTMRSGAAVWRLSTSRSGFTLTEVIVASAILAFAMVPVLKGLTGAHRTSVIIERKTKSTCLAQGKLDDIKARSIYNYSSNFTESGTSLEGAYLCDVDDTSLGSNLRSITVSTGYDENSNSALDPDEVDIVLATKLAKRW